MGQTGLERHGELIIIIIFFGWLTIPFKGPSPPGVVNKLFKNIFVLIASLCVQFQ